MSYRFGSFRLLPIERRLERDGVPVSIGSRAFDLLSVLVENGGTVVSKRDLTARAWPDTVVDEVSLRVHISALRKSLGTNDSGAAFISNVSGRGYMLSAEVETDVARSDTVTAPIAKTENHLPPPLLRMVGREAALGETCERLVSHRFVTVLGAGGMGKTTLAIAVAHKMSDGFRDGVLFVDLAPVTDGALVATTVASHFGVAAPAQAAVAVVCNFLKEKRILLLLDNCEHVIEAAAELAERAHRYCPELCILATSREALRVEGEQVYKITPLTTPAADVVGDDTRRFPAVQLFLDRMAAAGGATELRQGEIDLAAEICRRLDGMALALELTAARAASHGLSRTLELLQQRFGIHWGGRRTALPRHQTVLALHDWSYNLLSPDEKLVLRRAGWLSGPFTAEAASKISRIETDDVLDSLADKSLISRVLSANGALRYRLAETTKAYALDKLHCDPPEVERVARAHAEYFLDLLRVHAQKADPFHLSGISKILPEALANVRSAINWCYSEAGDPELGAQLVAYSSPLFLELSLLEECFRWSDRALSSLPSVMMDEVAEALLHQARAVSGIIVREARDIVTASFERALEIADSLGNLRLRLEIIAGFNIFLMRAGNCYAGARIADAAETACMGSSDVVAGRLVLWMKGICHAYNGDFIGARRVLEESCPVGGSVDLDLTLVVFTQFIRAKVQLARVQLLQGDGRRSEITARDAIDSAAAYSHPIPLCIALAYAASNAIWKGDLAVANGMIERLAEVSQRHSLAAFHAVSKGLSGEVRVRQGSAAEGVTMLVSAIEVMTSRNHEHMLVSFHAALAEAYAALGEVSHAIRHIETAISTARTGGEIFQMSDLLRIRGTLLISGPLDGHMDEGNADLRKAYETACDSGNSLHELRAATTLRRMLNSSEAEEMFESTLAKLPHEERLFYMDLVQSPPYGSGQSADGQVPRMSDISAVSTELSESALGPRPPVAPVRYCAECEP